MILETQFSESFVSLDCKANNKILTFSFIVISVKLYWRKFDRNIIIFLTLVHLYLHSVIYLFNF